MQPSGQHKIKKSLNIPSQCLSSLLTELDIDFGFIGITESRISKTNFSPTNIALANYVIEQTPTESNAGGALLYINRKHSYKIRKDLKLYKPHKIESVFVEVIMPKRTNNIIVGCIYRHPDNNIDEFNTNYLRPLLQKLSKESSKNIFLLGDFNIDLLKFNSCSSVRNFLDELSSRYFMPQIFLPSRITRSTKTLIDNMFCNIPQSSEQNISANLTTAYSYHLPQVLLVPGFYWYKNVRKSNVFIRDSQTFNNATFSANYKSTDWPNVMQIDKGNPNLSFHNYIEEVEKIISDHAPLRKSRKRERKFQSEPWISSGLQRSIAIKNQLFGKFIKSTNSIIKEKLHNDYKSYRNMISTLLKQSKKNYYDKYFKDNINNMKNTWKGIRSIISLQKTSNDSPKIISLEDHTVTDPRTIANTFNNFFCSVATGVQSEVPFSYKTFFEYLPPPNQDSLFISLCTKEEIIEIISNFKPKKSAGPNSIPTKILRLLTDDISEHLSIIFNISFATGIFPKKLKVAKVIPIHKKDSKLECSNYRPISLLSNTDKILEKLLHNRLMKFLTEHKILYLKQFGFRKNFSTAHAIINLIDSIENAFDKKKFACGVFIDLKKAFDTVDHETLLKNLWHYGIRGIANDWFKSYLTNRMQYVSIDGISSDLLKVNFGVPQGSVLGPLLFLLYINDLHNSIRFSSPFHFADDTGLLNIQDSIRAINKTLNKDLRELSFWLNANKIALNVAKTEIILFKTSNKNYDAVSK